MSRALPQRIKLSTYTATVSTGGQPKLDQLVSEVFVDGNLQPEQSAEVTLANVQAGIETGHLYLDISTTVNHQTMKATGEDGKVWDLVGPDMKAARARTQKIPIRRRLRT